MEGSSCDDDHSVLLNNSSSFSSSEEDDDRSRNSDESFPSSDFMEDASSSSSTSSSSISNGPLYELSDLMSHLPIKERQGLSKYYQGKSQSFTSLASVKSQEELVKKENPYKKRMKSRYNKSNNGYKCKYSSYGPKATIAKKVSRGASLLSSPMMSKRSLGVSLMGTFRPPIPSHSHQA